jgi:hypothetical protein
MLGHRKCGCGNADHGKQGCNRFHLVGFYILPQWTLLLGRTSRIRYREPKTWQTRQIAQSGYLHPSCSSLVVRSGYLSWLMLLGCGGNRGSVIGYRMTRSYFYASSQGRQKDGRQKIFCGVEDCGTEKGDERRRPSDPFDVFDFGSVNFLQIE